MQLANTAHFKVGHAQAAITFVEAAKAAAENGELDAAFKESARAPHKAKEAGTA
jgi:hypothetical protein